MAQHETQVLPTGAQIGVYEIKEVISSGRAGILYRAWNEHLNTMVALKEYLPIDYAERDEDGYSVKAKRINDASVYEYGKEKFLEFAEILTDIQQTNVVGVHNVLQFNGTAYLAMDFEEGVPLSKLQASSPSFSDAELTKILTSLLHALQAVHDKGTVHGDVHPSNIVIRHNGEPVLVNFAAARLALAAHSKGLLQELRSGFAPAELYHPDNLPGPSSDLYSLGATMYYCITRTDPGSILDRVEAFNNKQPDPYQTALEKQGAGFSEGLLKTINWMLHSNVEDRPQSAIEVLNVLGQDVNVSNIPEAGYKKMPVSQSDKVYEKDSKQASTGLLTTGIVAIVALFAVAFWYLRQEQPTETFETITKLETDKPAIEQPVDLTAEHATEEISLAAAPEFVDQESIMAEQEDTLEDKTSSGGQATANSDVSDSSGIPGSKRLPDDLAPSQGEESIIVQQEQQEPEPELGPEPGPEPIRESEYLDSPVPVGNDQKEKINQYLAKAENNIAEFNLTTPLDDNAFIQYQAILAIDPDNIKANLGLQRIIKVYTWLISDAIEEQQFHRARIYLERAEAIQPNMPELQSLRNELDNAEQ